MTNPEFIHVRLRFRDDASNAVRDDDLKYLYVKLDEIVRETTGIASYRILTDEDLDDLQNYHHG